MPFTPYGRLGNGRPILVGAEGPQGPTGPQGTAGPAGNYVNRYQGAWSVTTAYAVGDIVTYDGSSWLAQGASTGVIPAAGATWATVAAGGTGQVNTVNSKAPTAGNVALVASDVGAVASSALGVANGVATLAADGTLVTSQLPALALVSAQTVASQAAMLALSNVQPGDIAVRTDGAGTFILTAAPASTLSNWTLLNAPTDKVVSVNGQVGTVNLGAADVGAVATSAVGTGPGQIPTLDSGSLIPRGELGTGTRDGTRFLRDDGTWASIAAGGGSTLLGYTAYAPASSTIYTIATGANADVDAANLAVTFTAPSSGNVVAILAGSVAASTVNGSVALYWSLRNGTNNVAGTERRVRGQNGSIEQEAARIRITGLTPGTSYTYKWAARAVSQSGAMYAGGSSSEFATSSANYGPATMEVWSA